MASRPDRGASSRRNTWLRSGITSTINRAPRPRASRCAISINCSVSLTGRDAPSTSGDTGSVRPTRASRGRDNIALICATDNRVEVADTGQRDLGAQPEAVADREVMLDQPDAIRVLREKGQSDVVREIVTRVEPEHDPARSHARTVTAKREHLLMRSVRGDCQVDDLEALPGHEALQGPLEHCAVRLLMTDLEPFRLTVPDEQDPRDIGDRVGIGNRTAKAPRVVGHVDGILAPPRIGESSERPIDEIDLVVELNVLERLRRHESNADLGDDDRHNDTEDKGDQRACEPQPRARLTLRSGPSAISTRYGCGSRTRASG